MGVKQFHGFVVESHQDQLTIDDFHEYVQQKCQKVLNKRRFAKMNPVELRQKIEKNLSEMSSDSLKVIAEFVEFIKNKQEKTKPASETITYKPASGRSILRHAGTWVGDDLEDCLQLVYETRGKVKINNRLNPFE